MAITIQRVGTHDRSTLGASTSYGRSIQIDAGTGTRLVLWATAGRFTIEDQSAPTFNGSAMTQIASTTTGTAERVRFWELLSPSVGTFSFAVTDPANINDGAWWWAVLDGTGAGASTGYTFESASATSATPSATVGATDLALIGAGSVSYSGGGITAGTSIGGPFAGRSGGYLAGAVPSAGTWSANQTAAVTVVVPAAGGGGGSIAAISNYYRMMRSA